MSLIPTTMPAVAYRKNLPIDDPDSLVDIELPVPQPGPRDLLVQVEAVSVNPVDSKIRANADPGGQPRVLGWDAAGIVVAVGSEVELFAVGDEVYYAGALERPGTNARYHAVDERLVARKPAVSFTEAAALPLTALTAWEGLFEHLIPDSPATAEARQAHQSHQPHQGSGDRRGALLVTAAAGGVGSIVTQLATALTSLTVIGTASRPETVKFAQKMGAHHVIDHHQPLGPQLAEVAPDGLDYVFGTTATDRNLDAYAEALKPFGAIVAIDDFDSLPIGRLKAKSLSFHWEFMFTRSMFSTPDMIRQHEILTQVARLVDAGILTSTGNGDLGPVNAANLRRAHRTLEAGAAIGKITLTGF
ncbi:zinc-binding alcohol dehydrogenase family protein [Catenulispora rubra]|uniref:zinc-binding alcohol dehydrogenase family protein n=1 Tax=Catenulispora rubra TaxID=280293 RepID=UPI001E3C9839|nr:zinc-binding alcohol dehydrogenase family protein [Catenulispora rubra]